MIVRHYDIKAPETRPPQDEGWEPTWPGYYTMTKCVTPWRKDKFAERDQAIRERKETVQGDFGNDLMLSILADMKKKHVTMFELGAGWGRLCLSLAGIIDYKVMPLVPQSYRCLAVEAEPVHYQWVKEHFQVQHINGTAVHGAVADKNGSCWFNAGPLPDSCYGQAIDSPHRLIGLGSLLHIINIIKKNSIKVPVYTVDHLVQAYGFDHLDILQMDVQGAEYKAVLGAAKSISQDMIDYLWIGTHHHELNDALRQLLEPKYELIIDIYPNSVGEVAGFNPVRCHDGIQLYKRNNL